MVISRLLIGNYVFDVESPESLIDTNYFEITTINGFKVNKVSNQLFCASLQDYLLKLFNINVFIANTEYNRGVFKGILKHEQIKDIMAIINLTHINIYDIEEFDILEYELNCTNKHVQWFFKNKVNRHISDSVRRRAELERNLTIEKLEEKCDGFEWINKDMGMFQIKGVTNVEEFDKTIAPKFNMKKLDFANKRKELAVFMCSHYTSSIKTDIVGQVIDKPINKNKGKERTNSLAKIARNTVFRRENDDSSTDDDDY